MATPLIARRGIDYDQFDYYICDEMLYPLPGSDTDKWSTTMPNDDELHRTKTANVGFWSEDVRLIKNDQNRLRDVDGPINGNELVYLQFSDGSLAREHCRVVVAKLCVDEDGNEDAKFYIHYLCETSRAASKFEKHLPINKFHPYMSVLNLDFVVFDRRFVELRDGVPDFQTDKQTSKAKVIAYLKAR